MRIKGSGGFILDDRVSGQLAISRAFGDLALKKEGVIAEPTVRKYQLKPTDTWLIVATDGVWDHVSDIESVICCEGLSTSDGISKLIIKEAMKKGSQDNITCMVLKL